MTELTPRVQMWVIENQARHPNGLDCQLCLEGAPHFAHWFPGCTCAGAGGMEHASHCDLYGVTLRADDARLTEPDDYALRMADARRNELRWTLLARCYVAIAEIDYDLQQWRRRQ